MPEQQEQVAQLGAALAEVDRLLSGLSGLSGLGGDADERWQAATPCEGWTVRHLVQHLVDGNRQAAAALGTPDEDPPNADLSTEHHASARALVRAFARPGALDQVVSVPFGDVPGPVALHLRLTEALVHGWDLGRALAERPTFDDAVAEQELAFTRQALAGMPEGRRPFAPPQPVDDAAPPLDRLAALLGRSRG